MKGAITTSAISYPGQYKNKFLCHTFNSVDWSLAEIKYDELNLSELVVFQVEFLPNNLAALHTLYKNNDGKFIRKLIAINREYLDCYKYIS